MTKNYFSRIYSPARKIKKKEKKVDAFYGQIANQFYVEGYIFNSIMARLPISLLTVPLRKLN